MEAAHIDWWNRVVVAALERTPAEAVPLLQLAVREAPSKEMRLSVRYNIAHLLWSRLGRYREAARLLRSIGRHREFALGRRCLVESVMCLYQSGASGEAIAAAKRIALLLPAGYTAAAALKVAQIAARKAGDQVQETDLQLLVDAIVSDPNYDPNP